MPDIRSFYTSVLSQAFSPCEDFLAAGTNFGNLNIFSLSRTSTDDEVAQNNKTEELSQPLKQFSVSSKPVQGMVTLKDTLIVGGRNCLLGFNWDQLKQSKGLGKDVKPAWTTNLQLPGDFGSKETVDYITLDDHGSAFVACGDNCIYKVDLEYGKVTSCFKGHEDFIHSLSYYGGQLSSASEDGTVCIWDTKRAKCIHKIIPHSESKLQRLKLGKWVGAVTMNDDWLVCGGGPHLALYHLRSLTLSRVLLEEDPHAVNSVVFNDDSIVVGMNGPFVYHVLFSGDITCKTPTTPLRVYSLALQKGDKKLLTVGGAGAGIDICLSSKFQDQIAYCIA